MPKSKHRKNHKKKVAARRERLQHAKKRMEKMQREFIEQLINQEKQKGLFDNVPAGPEIDGPIIENGPTIEGPSI